MSRVEVSKETLHVLTGPPTDSAAVSKLTMHLWMIPDPNPSEDETQQGHVWVQLVRRS